MPWLKSYATAPFPEVMVGNFEAGWPRFLEVLGSELSPALFDFGERFPSMVPWFCDSSPARHAPSSMATYGWTNCSSPSAATTHR